MPDDLDRRPAVTLGQSVDVPRHGDLVVARVRDPGLSRASQVRRDHRMVDRELGDQRQPHMARLAESVEHNDRRTGAGLEVVQSHTVDCGEAAVHRLGQ